jgi:hypothetical protein
MSIGVIRHRLSLGAVAVLWWHSLATEVGLSTGFNQSQHLIITGDYSPYICCSDKYRDFMDLNL